jgi:selenophosphate synthetase-related protein
VGNDNDTTLESLESLGQGTQRVTVEIVGGLVEDDDVRTLPRAGGED